MSSQASDILFVDPGPKSTKFLEEAYIRLERVGGRRLVTLTDMERIVSLVLEGEDIVDCLALRRKQYVLDSITAEAEYIELTGKMPNGVEILEERLDVGWYGRRCRKRLRDALRAGAVEGKKERLEGLEGDMEVVEGLEDDMEVVEGLEGDMEVVEGNKERVEGLEGDMEVVEGLKKLLERQELEKGLAGTKFCSRKVPQMAFKEEHLGEKKGMDRCCMALWDCPSIIGVLSYSYRHLNANTFPMFSCPCMDNFLQCLAKEEEEGDDEAAHLGRMWAEHGGGCADLEEVEECDEYDRWFDGCVTANYTMVASVRRT